MRKTYSGPQIKAALVLLLTAMREDNMDLNRVKPKEIAKVLVMLLKEWNEE